MGYLWVTLVWMFMELPGDTRRCIFYMAHRILPRDLVMDGTRTPKIVGRVES